MVDNLQVAGRTVNFVHAHPFTEFVPIVVELAPLLSVSHTSAASAIGVGGAYVTGQALHRPQASPPKASSLAGAAPIIASSALSTADLTTSMNIDSAAAIEKPGGLVSSLAPRPGSAFSSPVSVTQVSNVTVVPPNGILSSNSSSMIAVARSPICVLSEPEPVSKPLQDIDVSVTKALEPSSNSGIDTAADFALTTLHPVPSTLEEVLQSPLPQRVTSGDGIMADPDLPIHSQFFSSRQAFLNLCQGNHYQFDSLRRAKHSSMMFLWHMHNPSAPAFVHSCNNCAIPVMTGFRWNCSLCEDFDLCSKCQKDHTHPHRLAPYPVTSTLSEEEKRVMDEVSYLLSTP